MTDEGSTATHQEVLFPCFQQPQYCSVFFEQCGTTASWEADDSDVFVCWKRTCYWPQQVIRSRMPLLTGKRHFGERERVLGRFVPFALARPAQPECERGVIVEFPAGFTQNSLFWGVNWTAREFATFFQLPRAGLELDC